MDYIPLTYLTLTNKKNYLSSILLKRDEILDHTFDRYIRDVVRQDNDFVFDSILCQYIHTWDREKKFKFKGITYKSYIEYIKYYSESIESHKCNLLIKKIYMSGKKQHKKVHTKKYKWIRWI